MKLIKAINCCFFPIEEDEQITISDGIWFYGMLLLFIIIGLVSIIAS